MFNIVVGSLHTTEWKPFDGTDIFMNDIICGMIVGNIITPLPFYRCAPKAIYDRPFLPTIAQEALNICFHRIHDSWLFKAWNGM